MKKTLLTLLLVFFAASTLGALSAQQKEDLKRYEKMWQERKDKLSEEIRAYEDIDSSHPDYARYKELAGQLVEAHKKTLIYKEAQETEAGWVTVIRDTLVFTLQDGVTLAKMMWAEHENLLLDIFKGKWKELAQSLLSQTIKLNLGKKVEARLGFACPAAVEHFFTQMIEPKVQKDKLQEKAEEAAGKAKEWLQKKYVEEAKKIAMEKGEKELAALVKKGASETAMQSAREKVKDIGENLAKKVGAAIEAFEFTVEAAQKLFLLGESMDSIEGMIGQMGKTADMYRKYEKSTSCRDVFDIFMGRKEIDPEIKKLAALDKEQENSDKKEEELAKKISDNGAKTEDGSLKKEDSKPEGDQEADVKKADRNFVLPQDQLSLLKRLGTSNNYAEVAAVIEKLRPKMVKQAKDAAIRFLVADNQNWGALEVRHPEVPFEAFVYQVGNKGEYSLSRLVKLKAPASDPKRPAEISKRGNLGFHGSYKNYHENTRIPKEESFYIRGLYWGPFKSYHSSGKLESEGMYEADRRVGTWSFYWFDGALESRGSYNQRGEKHGPWTETKLDYGIRSPKAFTVIYTDGKLTDKTQKDAVFKELQQRGSQR